MVYCLLATRQDREATTKQSGKMRRRAWANTQAERAVFSSAISQTFQRHRAYLLYNVQKQTWLLKYNQQAAPLRKPEIHFAFAYVSHMPSPKPKPGGGRFKRESRADLCSYRQLSGCDNFVHDPVTPEVIDERVTRLDLMQRAIR